jgi:hypothetical protein
MTDEQSWERGRKAAYIAIGRNCLRALGFDNAEAASIAHIAWIDERQAAVSALRDLCETFGDNDWPDELHLSDVIEKHLARPLYRKNTYQEPMMTWAEHQADKAQFVEVIVPSIVRGVMHDLGINDSKRIHDEVQIWLNHWRDCVGSKSE